MDVAIEGICQQDQIIKRSEILELGANDKWIRSAIRRGFLRRVRHGTYTLASIWDPADQRTRHLIAATGVLRRARSDAVLSHVTAAIALGADTWDVDLSIVDVTRLDRKSGRKETGVRQHRRPLRRKKDVRKAAGLACTSPARTAIDVTTCLDTEHALVIVDSLLHQGLVTTKQLKAAHERLKASPHTLSTRTVLALADGASSGPAETRARYAIHRAGLPAPITQLHVYDHGELFAMLDFAWPDLKVWVEFDGKVKYEKYLRDGETPGDAVFREKQREDRLRELTGWRCLRITWADLEHPERWIGKLRQMLGLAAA